MSNYPLTERMKSAKGKAAREFLDWLLTQNLHLARDIAGDSRRYTVGDTVLVARFLGIDPDALESERTRIRNEQMPELKSRVINPAKV